MPSRLLSRIKKLEKRVPQGNQNLLVVIMQAGETEAQAITRSKHENPDFESGLIVIVNTYGE